jgi:hypothetical protein
MQILFDASAPVKVSSDFGRGLLASAPVYQADHTLEDEQWWARETAAAEEAAFNRYLEEMAQEREWQARYEAGRLTDEDVIIATGCCG